MPASTRSPRTGQHEPVVIEAFSLALDIFRPLATAYAAWLSWQRHASMARPWVAAVTVGVLGVWSLAMLFYRRRSGPVVITEVTITVLGVFATLWADTPAAVARGQYTLPTLWAAGAVSGTAVVYGARGGLISAGVVALADLVEIRTPTQTTFHNIVLLFLLGGLVGLSVDLARRGEQRLVAALAEQEQLRERDRLARAVHDGVLQTLAYIHRRGQDLGGPTAELGQMAAEQERSLRRLVSGSADADAVTGADAPAAEVDLRALLVAHEDETVSVSVPADPVLLSRGRAQELAASVTEALTNVARHAGAHARAWVLLETDDTSVSVTVRDNGVGADPARFAEAVRDGRMGVSRSIIGRAEALGGTAKVTARPGGGVRVVLDVPTRDPGGAPPTHAITTRTEGP